MISLEVASQKHVDEIAAIEIENFSEPWSKNAVSFEIKHAICFAAWDAENSAVAGYATMRQIFDEGHISNIAVAKKYQKQGIGNLLITALIQAAIANNINGLTLEVRESNHAALALYNKHGFVKEGIRKNYYSYPNEDAIIMWKYLNKGAGECEN